MLEIQFCFLLLLCFCEAWLLCLGEPLAPLYTTHAKAIQPQRRKPRRQPAENAARTQVLLEGSTILPSPILGEKARDN